MYCGIIIFIAILVLLLYRQQILALIAGLFGTTYLGGDSDNVSTLPDEDAVFEKMIRDKIGAKDINKSGAKDVVKDLKQNPRSKSEKNTIQLLESITKRKFPTVNPDWLVWRGKTLELDGYDGKLALEFSGPLHTKWFPGVEPYEKYFDRIVKDIVKIKTCKLYGIPLIVIDSSLPSHHRRNYLLSRLWDLGLVTEEPVVYINEQTAVPYRNPQIERELNLAPLMEAAEKIGT